MPFKRDDLNTLRDRITADLESVAGLQPRLRHTVENAIAHAQAGGMHALYSYMDYLATQMHPYTATDTSWIEHHAAQWLDVVRKPSVQAKGAVLFTGLVGSIIAAGTLIQRVDGFQYTTDIEVILAANGVSSAVTAVLPGVNGNADLISSLSLVSPIAGVNSACAVNTAISNGLDAESDSRLKSRYLARIKEPPHGGSDNDYITWALEIAGITRAWVYPHELALGGVTVRIVSDDAPTGMIPDAAKVNEVKAHINNLRPVSSSMVSVAAPIAEPLNPIIHLIPDSSSARTAVEAELNDLLFREAIPAATIPLSHIGEAISIAAGEVDHNLISPVADVAHSTGRIAVLGAITWQ